MYNNTRLVQDHGQFSKLNAPMKKNRPLLLVLAVSMALAFYSCKKDSSGSGGSGGDPSDATRVSSYKMFQGTNLYESWVNTYTGNLLTGVTSKVYYNGDELHFKTSIDYNNNRVSDITSYDSTASAWIKNWDFIVTSWSAGGLPAEKIFTFYEATGGIHQQNKTDYTYSNGQVTEKIQMNYWQGTLALYARTEFTYDQNAKLVKEITYNKDSSVYSTDDISWQNNLVVQDHIYMSGGLIAQKTVYTYSAGRLANATTYNDNTPMVPDLVIDYSYDQNGCLIVKKSTVVSSSAETSMQYTYEPGLGNFKQVSEFEDIYFDPWNGNPRLHPSKAITRIPGMFDAGLPTVGK